MSFCLLFLLNIRLRNDLEFAEQIKSLIYLDLIRIDPLTDDFVARSIPRRPKKYPVWTGGNPRKYAGHRGHERKDGRTERQADKGKRLRSVQTDKLLYFLFLK